MLKHQNLQALNRHVDNYNSGIFSFKLLLSAVPSNYLLIKLIILRGRRDLVGLAAINGVNLITQSLITITGHRWIPRTKASDAELWCFLWSAHEQTVEM